MTTMPFSDQSLPMTSSNLPNDRALLTAIRLRAENLDCFDLEHPALVVPTRRPAFLTPRPSAFALLPAITIHLPLFAVWSISIAIRSLSMILLGEVVLSVPSGKLTRSPQADGPNGEGSILHHHWQPNAAVVAASGLGALLVLSLVAMRLTRAALQLAQVPSLAVETTTIQRIDSLATTTRISWGE